MVENIFYSSWKSCRYLSLSSLIGPHRKRTGLLATSYCCCWRCDDSKKRQICHLSDVANDADSTLFDHDASTHCRMIKVVCTVFTCGQGRRQVFRARGSRASCHRPRGVGRGEMVSPSQWSQGLRKGLCPAPENFGTFGFKMVHFGAF